MDVEHVTAVCTGLGSLREDASGRDVYVKHPDCLVNLKHLQRFLRRDDPTVREIFMQLGKWNTIRQDILPIITHYRHDFDLVLNAVKVMVFLTMPIYPSSADIPQQLDHLRQFKAAVLEDDAIGVIVSHLQDPLEHMESGSLTDMDGKMFQLVLTLIRNLLAVDDPSSPLVRASVANTQALYIKDALVERLFNENVMDLLLALTQHVGGEKPFLRLDNLLILEILNFLLSGQTPEVIASSRDKVQKQPRSQPSGAALKALMTKEREERRNRSFGGPRHSNFCGMFVRVGKDGSKTIITRNPYQSPLDNLFQKPEIKRGQVRKVATDLPLHVPSNPTVCAMLRGFADQLLEGNYNLLMQTIKADIRSERNNVQSQDIVMFFAVANFFTAYQRCLLMKKKPDEDAQQIGESQIPIENIGAVFQGRCGRIASTMDDDMFILVTMKWQAFVEAAKETNDWFPATSSGVLLKEMIYMLDYILKASEQNTSEGQQEIRVARILLYKVFYDHTENGILPFIFRLMKTFDIHKQPRSQLAGLVETTHIVLRLLDSITKQEGALRVKKKVRSAKKKNPKSKKASQPCGPGGKDQDLSQEETNSVPLSDAQDRLDDSNANARVYSALHTNTNLGPIDDVEAVAVEGHNNDIEEHDDDEFEDKRDHGGEESESDSEEEDEGEEEVQTKEETLDVMKCVRMFADNTILHNYCWLLKNYLHNTPAMNYYIVRMLQRICHDLMMEPMLYQLSILQTCYEILSNNSIRNSEQHQFVISFLTKLVCHLFEKLKTSPMLFVDLLFWKSKQDCHCITANYTLHGLKKFSSGGKSISKETDVQDRRALLNSLGDDDEDDMGNDANVPRTETLFRSMDSNKEKGKVTRQKAMKKKGPFTDFEVDLIKDLFVRFQENRSCSKLIAHGLEEAGAVRESGEPFTPAQVGRAMKRLGLARVVRKKTSQNKSFGNISNPSDSENESGSDDQREGQSTDAGENNDPGSSPDEDMSEEDNLADPSRRKGLLESLNEDSDDEGHKQDGAGKNSEAGSDEQEAAGENLSSKVAIKKRKSGVSEVQGGNDISKRRRRSGLFSKEQDHKLQSLFEKYKGMTRFKHLILNDLEGVFTTAQIGRRLQQLGCVEPRKQKSKLAKMSEDEDEIEQSKPGNGDKHISDKEDGVGHSSDDSQERTKLPIKKAFKASLGLSTQKNAQMSKSTAVVEGEAQLADTSDDDLPIALHHPMRSIFQKKKSPLDNEASPKEQKLQMRDGGESTGFETTGDRNCFREQLGLNLGVDQPMDTNTSSEINYLDDRAIEDSVAELIPKTFQRKRLQSENQSMLPIECDMEKSGDSDSGDDADTAIANRTYERKRRPSVEQNIKSSTWGDSETDASDIEDTRDLAMALQEVRIYENQRATKLKKRRLERKQLSIREVDDDANDELIINTQLQGDPSDGPTLHTHLTSRKGARKALIDVMASDEDE